MLNFVQMIAVHLHAENCIQDSTETPFVDCISLSSRHQRVLTPALYKVTLKKEIPPGARSGLLTLSSMVSNLVSTIPSMSRGVWAME